MKIHLAIFLVDLNAEVVRTEQSNYPAREGGFLNCCGKYPRKEAWKESQFQDRFHWKSLVEHFIRWDYLNLLKLKFKVTRESNDFNAELSSHHLLNPFSLKSNSVSEGRPKIWCGISPSNSFLCSRSSFSDLKLLNRWKRVLASD